jgi:hypothetical protein
MRQAVAISGGPDAVAVFSLHHRVATSIERLRNRLHIELPLLAQDVSTWMDDIAPGGEAANYLSDPLMFPIVQLPGWLFQTLTGRADADFLSDVSYSTVSGYYHIRLLDNVRDRHGTIETSLLPATGLFEREFRSVYQKYFSPEHPFWNCFERFWVATTASVEKEATLRDMELEDFREIAANKFAAAKIPLSAVAYSCQRPDVLPLWLHFCDEFARATQSLDDLFDWQDDLQGGRCTYFLAEGARRKEKHESTESFVLREGFFRGAQCLREWTMLVHELATQLNCRALIQYLDQREQTLAAKLAPIQRGLENLQQLRVILDNPPEHTQTDSHREVIQGGNNVIADEF